MDSLFREYGNPIPLLDGVISSGQFSGWIDAHEENKNEKVLWEMYLHKLSFTDERSFSEFKSDMMNGIVNFDDIPSNEQLSATVRKSMDICNNFDSLQEGG